MQQVLKVNFAFKQAVLCFKKNVSCVTFCSWQRSLVKEYKHLNIYSLYKIFYPFLLILKCYFRSLIVYLGYIHSSRFVSNTLRLFLSLYVTRFLSVTRSLSWSHSVLLRLLNIDFFLAKNRMSSPRMDLYELDLAKTESHINKSDPKYQYSLVCSKYYFHASAHLDIIVNKFTNIVK